MGTGERGRLRADHQIGSPRAEPRGNERLTAMTGAVLVVQVEADDLAVAPFPLPAATGFARLFKRPGSRWARVVLVAVNLAAVTAFLLSYSRHGVGFGPYRIDLAAYRSGGRTWRAAAARAVPHPGHLVTSNTVNRR